MKIGIFCNTVNFHYSLCKQLRNIHSDTEIVLDSLENYPTHLPIWNDRDFQIHLNQANDREKFEIFLQDLKARTKWKNPDWIKEVPKKLSPKYYLSALTIPASYYLLRLFFCKPSTARLRVFHESVKNYPRLKEYDILMLTGLGPFYGKLLNKPFLMWPNGGDINDVPFQSSDPNPIYKERSTMMNFGLHSSKKILSQMPTILDSLKKLGLEKKYEFWSPFFGDPEIFKPMKSNFSNLLDEKIFSKLREMIVFYMPTRIDFDEKMGKGTGKAINAFARLCKNYNNVFLITQGWYMNSSKVLELIKNLKIENNVYFNPYLLSKPRLARFFNASDAVLNNFSMNTYGSTDVEVLACGKPLITNMNMEFVKKYQGEEPPILQAFDEDSIYQKMELVVKDKVPSTIIDDSVNWVKKHHGQHQVKILLEHLLSIA